MLRRFLSDTVLYSIPNFFSRAIGLLLILFYTRYLSPSDYGLIELIIVLFSLLNVLLPLEITQGVARHFNDASLKEKSGIISTSIIFTIAVFSLFWVLSLAFSTQFSDYFFSGLIKSPLISYIFIFFIFYSLLKLCENQLRWSLEPKSFSFLSISGSLLMSICPVYLIFFEDLGLEGYIKGALIGAFFSSLIGLIIVRRTHELTLSFHFKILKELLSFSSPLVLSSAAYYVFNFSDRWMLQFYVSTDAVGIYGAASRLASIAIVIHVLFRYSFMPLVYATYKEPETESSIHKIFSFVLHLGLLFSACIFLFSSEIVAILLGQSYSQAGSFLWILSLSLLFVNLYFYFPGLSIAKKTKQMAAISIFVALLNIIGNFLLIPAYHEYGAAISSFFSSLALLLLYFWLGQKHYKINLNFVRLCAFPLLLLCICFLENAFQFGLFLKLSAFLLCLVIIFFTHKEFLNEALKDNQPT